MPVWLLHILLILVVACTCSGQSDLKNTTSVLCDSVECQKKCDESKGSLVNCNATNFSKNKESGVKNTILSKADINSSKNDEMSVASFETIVILLLVASLAVVWWRKKRLV